jgi:hypothetical protein
VQLIMIKCMATWQRLMHHNPQDDHQMFNSSVVHLSTAAGSGLEYTHSFGHKNHPASCLSLSVATAGTRVPVSMGTAERCERRM